jgi:hypothetical protein
VLETLPYVFPRLSSAPYAPADSELSAFPRDREVAPASCFATDGAAVADVRDVEEVVVMSTSDPEFGFASEPIPELDSAFAGRPKKLLLLLLQPRIAVLEMRMTSVRKDEGDLVGVAK